MGKFCLSMSDIDRPASFKVGLDQELMNKLTTTKFAKVAYLEDFMRLFTGFGFLASLCLVSLPALGNQTVQVVPSSSNLDSCLASYSVDQNYMFCIRSAGEGVAAKLLPEEKLLFVDTKQLPLAGRKIISYGDKHIVAANEVETDLISMQSDTVVFEIEYLSRKELPLRGDLSPLEFSNAEQRDIPIDQGSMMSFLEILTGDREYTLNGNQVKLVSRGSPQGRQLTQDVLLDFFMQLGLDAQKKCYSRRSFQGCNIEVVIPGEDSNQSIVVGTHFDSVTLTAADDNGTGTAFLMELARNLRGMKFKKTIRLVAFDQEEKGLIGSAAYVESLKASGTAMPAMAFMVDMIGYDSNNDGAVHVVDCGRSESTPMSQVFFDAAKQLGIRIVNSTTCTNRSDHASFWNSKIPAVLVAENFFGGDGNKCYHKSCDTIANINTDYYYRVAKTSAGAIATFAGSTEN